MKGRFRATKTYHAAYPVPLEARAGEVLRIERRDDEWPGWVWCVSAHSPAGWVPEAWLRPIDEWSAALLRDYTARELSVKVGDVLSVMQVESGWAWATTERGEPGWVPLDALEDIAGDNAG